MPGNQLPDAAPVDVGAATGTQPDLAAGSRLNPQVEAEHRMRLQHNPGGMTLDRSARFKMVKRAVKKLRELAKYDCSPSDQDVGAK